MLVVWQKQSMVLVKFMRRLVTCMGTSEVILYSRGGEIVCWHSREKIWSQWWMDWRNILEWSPNYQTLSIYINRVRTLALHTPHDRQRYCFIQPSVCLGCKCTKLPNTVSKRCIFCLCFNTHMLKPVSCKISLSAIAPLKLLSTRTQGCSFVEVWVMPFLKWSDMHFLPITLEKIQVPFLKTISVNHAGAPTAEYLAICQ